MHMKSFLLTPLRFVVILATYALISNYLFLLTSGGWSSLFYHMITPFVYLVIIITSAITAFINHKKDKKVKVHLCFILVLLCIQCIYLLLNFGDCGDNPGTYTFIEKTINGIWQYCSYASQSRISHYAMLILPFTYFGILFLFILNSFGVVNFSRK